MVTELDVRTATTELSGGRVLRVSSVARPREDGREIVIERLVGSASARNIMAPSDGDRLTIDAGELPELRALLDEVAGDA